MTYQEVIKEGGFEAYDLGSAIVYRIPIRVAYYDRGIPKDKDGWDVTKPYKDIIIKK